MDILICRIKYPNDPKNQTIPHQHFVSCYKDGILELYSISSILGKEYKVYNYDGIPNPDHYFIIGEEQNLCSLRSPSFIDCAKSYSVNITNNMDIGQLSQRDMPAKIVNNIKKRIQETKDNGNHVQYTINSDDFLNYNAKCKK